MPTVVKMKRWICDDKAPIKRYIATVIKRHSNRTKKEYVEIYEGNPVRVTITVTIETEEEK